jgi:hypothetical protein
MNVGSKSMDIITVLLFYSLPKSVCIQLPEGSFTFKDGTIRTLSQSLPPMSIFGFAMATKSLLLWIFMYYHGSYFFSTLDFHSYSYIDDIARYKSYIDYDNFECAKLVVNIIRNMKQIVYGMIQVVVYHV